jgi:magnesium transporter
MINLYRKRAVGHVEKLDKIVPDCWIDLINPTPEEIRDISTKANIDEKYLKYPLDKREKPRIDIDKNCISVIITAPYHSRDNKLSTVPLSIILTPKFIITESLKDLRVLMDFFENKVTDFSTEHKNKVLLQIINLVNQYYQDFLYSIEKKIEDTEGTIIKSLQNEEIMELLVLQKSLIYIDTAIISNDKVLDKIMNWETYKLGSEERKILEDIIIDNKQLIDMVGIYNNILSNTMDAYVSLVSNNLNVIMKYLTAITIVITLPNLIASFWGMNVALPMQNGPHTFTLIVLIAVAISLIALFFFYKNRYL